jgi:DNA-directed RNA polymerase subunit RPC12/RpoP
MKCPACGSSRLYPSRLKNAYERLRQALTDKQPYRCHECGWRKWRDVFVHPQGPDVSPEDLRTGRGPRPVSPAELDELDAIDPTAASR